MELFVGNKIKEYFGMNNSTRSDPLENDDIVLLQILLLITLLWVLIITHSIKYPFRINGKAYVVIGLALAVISPSNYILLTLIIWMVGLNRLKK